MKSDKISLLLSIAKRGGMQNKIRVSAIEIASELKISQQTANRWLLELQAEGILERRFKHISLTDKGVLAIESLAADIRLIFDEAKTKMRLVGSLIGGMHEGRFYLSIPEYKKQIRKAIGFEVYPGTLNLRMGNARSSDGKRKLMNMQGIRIDGFQKNGRLLGGANLFRATISAKKNTAQGAIIIPNKSHYGAEVLEIISDVNLREKLKIKNNDEVEVEIEL
jgi:riboflavin kinase, archaea type